MAEYIDREAAVKAVRCSPDEAINDEMEQIVREVPAAKVATVREGAWINREYGTMVCSFCHTVEKQSSRARLHFCPTCGAKMDGGING